MSGRLLNASPAACATRSSFGFTVIFAGWALIACLAGCGGADNRPAKWSYIAPAIIEPNCATVSCHSSVAQRAGVILEPAQTAYNTVTQRHFVVTCPSDADAGTTCMDMAVATSEILYLLRAQGSQRMPPDQALPEADIHLIQTWIADGAQNN
jgi:hypothetical protein